MFYQNSVIKKYLSLLKAEPLSAAWEQYKTYFLDHAIQDNIRASKEEQFQEGFLRELFVQCLGYTLNPSPDFNLITEQKNETNAKKADGAILNYGKVVGVIELKDHKTTDLSLVERQAFGYKNQHKDTHYVIISNFEKLRFYIDNTVEYIEWNLFTLTEDQFRLLYFCLAWENIRIDLPLKAKTESVSNEDEITKQLYKDYSAFKREVFADILAHNTDDNTPKEHILILFKKTQKLLDRLLFIFFAEDSGLLPPNSMVEILNQWEQLKEMDEYVPLYSRIKKYFGYMNTGWQGKKYEIFAYNGGLFKPDEILDSLIISDDVLARFTRRLADYDYSTEVDVNILGHIFENSLNEIEEVTAQIRSASIPACDNSELNAASKDARAPGKRKRDGVFYTPQYITKYIIENTIGKLCAEKKAELGIVEHVSERADRATFGNVAHNKKHQLAGLQQYREWLLGLTICDPACGSGAFLNAALQFLMAEHRLIDEIEAQVTGSSIVFQNIENSILENNLYGVDINEESVEIAKLALWLRTAKPHRKLSSLNNNIKCGNSLISDPAIAGEKAFDWQKEFPQVFRDASTTACETKNGSASTTACESIAASKGARAPGDHACNMSNGKYNSDIKPWHCRHYLPHIEDKQFQFITFRLYDSMPKDIIAQWKEELHITDENNTPVHILTQLLKRIDKYEDAGYGQCFLKNERVAKVVEDTLLKFDGERYRLLSWCIMPNHVHVLIEMMPEYSLTSILHSWRSFTANEANKILGRKGEFWQKEYFDRYIRNAQHFRDAVDYIDNNPVKAGLVAIPEEWPFGSAYRNASTHACEIKNGNASTHACEINDINEDSIAASKGARAPGSGFDIVIGNPPYVRAELLPQSDIEYYRQNYKAFTPDGDLFSYFYEQGLNILKEGGIFCFISNTFDKTAAGKSLRQYIQENATIEKYVDFTEVQVFEGATTYPIILSLSKAKKKDHFPYIKIPREMQGNVDIALAPAKNVLQTSLDTESWSFQSAEMATIIAKLKAFPTIKEQYGKCYRGLLTGLNDAFFIDEATKCRLIAEDAASGELIKPVFEGKDLHKWYNAPLQKYLICTHNGYADVPAVDIELFPAIKAHLEQFEPQLSRRYDKGNTPFNLRNCAYQPLFCQPKIIWGNLQNGNKFSFDDRGTVISAPACMLPTDNKALLAILNSRMVWIFLTSICVVRNGGYIEVKPQYFEQIPIPPLEGNIADELSVLADRMLSLNKELQEKRARFLRRMQDNFRSASTPARDNNNASKGACAPDTVRITPTLETFDTLDFAGFVAELKKQKIRLSLTEQDEWEEYFSNYKTACNTLSAEIATTDHEIDRRVYDLYGLTDEERAIVESPE